MMYVKSLLLFITLKSFAFAIWPPPYKVNLSQQETFVIFEGFGSEDDIYSEEDEMIKPRDIEHMKLEKQSDRFFRLHRLAAKKNKENEQKYVKREEAYQKMRETNFKYDELVPWVGGFVDKNGTIKENMNVYYSNAYAKRAIEEGYMEKREEILSVHNITGDAKNINYDYNDFKKEYGEEIKEAKFSNDTLNYTDVKEEESVKDAIDTLIDFNKTPRNCTKEEIKGIGLGTVECFWLEITNVNNTSKTGRWALSKRILRFMIIWFCIYLLVAIPCWCQKGWCCCCFRCKMCRPMERIDEAKKFLMDNPPGVYYTAADGEILFQATIYERHAQKKLEQVLMKL